MTNAVEETRMEPDWITLTEAAERIQALYASSGRSVSRKTISRWAASGKIEAKREGRYWKVNAESLRAAAAETLGEVEAGHVEETPADEPAPLEPEEPAEDAVSALRRFIQRRNALFLRDLEDGVD